MRRETKVLVATADGRTSQHIANVLCLSLLTIEAHRRHLLTKFGVNNTVLLIRQAAQHGLMQRSLELEVKTEVTIL